MIYGNDNSIDNNSLYKNRYRQINIFYNGSKNINNQDTNHNSSLIILSINPYKNIHCNKDTK